MKILIPLIFGLWFLCGGLSAQSVSSGGLNVGDAAPDFALPYATRDSVAEDSLRLSSFIGKKNVILAFFPADWSGGCTKEMCTMRDNFEALSKLDAELLPISGDYEYAHHAWAKEMGFPFKLVSDHLHNVARQYQSYNEGYGWNKRTVYLVDKSGKIAYIDPKYVARDPNSFAKLQDALKQLK